MTITREIIGYGFMVAWALCCFVIAYTWWRLFSFFDHIRAIMRSLKRIADALEPSAPKPEPQGPLNGPKARLWDEWRKGSPLYADLMKRRQEKGNGFD